MLLLHLCALFFNIPAYTCSPLYNNLSNRRSLNPTVNFRKNLPLPVSKGAFHLLQLLGLVGQTDLIYPKTTTKLSWMVANSTVLTETTLIRCMGKIDDNTSMTNHTFYNYRLQNIEACPQCAWIVLSPWIADRLSFSDFIGWLSENQGCACYYLLLLTMPLEFRNWALTANRMHHVPVRRTRSLHGI